MFLELKKFGGREKSRPFFYFVKPGNPTRNPATSQPATSQPETSKPENHKTLLHTFVRFSDETFYQLKSIVYDYWRTKGNQE